MTVENTVRSLDEVANILGVSTQRVQFLENRALAKLRHAFARQMPTLQLVWDKQGYACGLKEVQLIPCDDEPDVNRISAETPDNLGLKNIAACD